MAKLAELVKEVADLKRLSLEHEARLRELETELVSLKARVTVKPPDPLPAA